MAVRHECALVPYTVGRVLLGEQGEGLWGPFGGTSGSLLLSPLRLKLCQQPKELNKCFRSPEVLDNQQGILIKATC